jgi:hypothetical protein
METNKFVPQFDTNLLENDKKGLEFKSEGAIDDENGLEFRSQLEFKLNNSEPNKFEPEVKMESLETPDIDQEFQFNGIEAKKFKQNNEENNELSLNSIETDSFKPESKPYNKEPERKTNYFLQTSYGISAEPVIIQQPTHSTNSGMANNVFIVDSSIEPHFHSNHTSDNHCCRDCRDFCLFHYCCYFYYTLSKIFSCCNCDCGYYIDGVYKCVNCICLSCV